MLAQKYLSSPYNILYDTVCVFLPRDGYIDPTTQFSWSGKGVNLFVVGWASASCRQTLTLCGFWSQTHDRMFPGGCEGINDELFQLW